MSNPAEPASAAPHSSLLDTKSRLEHHATHRKQTVHIDSTRHVFRRVALRFPIFSLILLGLIVAGAAGTTSAPRSSASQSSSSKLVIAADLPQQFAKFKPIKIPFDSKGLSAREKKMVDKLVDAAGLLDCIYWRQSDPVGLKLYLSLAHSENRRDQMLREYLKINGGRYDLINDNKPFVGTQPMPPGRGFFPWGMTKQEFDALVDENPGAKAVYYNPYTILVNSHIDPMTAGYFKLPAAGVGVIAYHNAYR